VRVSVGVLALGLLLAPAGPACQATGGAPSPAPAAAAQPLVERGPTPRLDPAALHDEEIIKRGGEGPTLVDSPVDLEAAAAHAPLTQAGLSAGDRARLTALPLPVLLPDDADLLSRAEITTGARWYAADIPLDGAGLFVTGSAAAVRLPNQAAISEPAGGLLLTRNEGVVTLTFRAYGVAYAVLVECASPFHDPRCTEDDYALGLAAHLGRVAPEAQP
jgi:hypothetical protein